MQRWRLALLIFELVLFAVILILPQVDLPDFTFHGGTAPVTAKARVTPLPLRAMAAPLPTGAIELSERSQGAAETTVSSASHSRLSLSCVLTC